MRLLVAAALVSAVLAGCVSDTDDTPQGPASTASWENPVTGPVTGLEPVARLGDAIGNPFPSAGGIWAHGDYVFGSGLGAGFFIADVSDPTAPVLVYSTPEDALTGFSRDADVVAHPDGRLSLVLATQNDGMHVYDVTDPSMPQFLARVFDETVPNHNVAVIPGTTLVFNSQSRGEGGTNDLVDLSDPTRPQVVGEYGTHGCHDISFFGTAGEPGLRAYCAGIDRTEIWNLDGLVADPAVDGFGIELVSVIDGLMLSPVVGNDIINTLGYPVRTLHHLAMVDETGTILIVGDEHNGGGSPGTCLLYDETTGTSTPLGALWFYDISDETSPELLSWFSPPTVAPNVPPNVDPGRTDPTNPGGALSNVPNCTAHFGTLVPGEQKLVMAWYSAGVLLIDFSDPAVPVLLDQYQPDDGINTWDARVHNGYVFTGDIVRGMETLRLL